MRPNDDPNNGPEAAQQFPTGTEASNLSSAACVGQALDHLKDGIIPFIREQITQAEEEGVLKEDWTDDFDRLFGREAEMLQSRAYDEWDVPLIVAVVTKLWNPVFRGSLRHEVRNLLFEARNARNHWAHRRPFSDGDAYRAVDTVARILNSICGIRHQDVEQLQQVLLKRMQGEDTKVEPVAEEDEQPEDGESDTKWRMARWPVVLLVLIAAIVAVFYFFILPPEQECHPSYPDICLNPNVSDYDCNDIVERGFRVLQPDPYNLDADGDGRGCENFPGQ